MPKVVVELSDFIFKLAQAMASKAGEDSMEEYCRQVIISSLEGDIEALHGSGLDEE